MLMVVNFSKEELTLPKGKILGKSQGISENLVVSVSNEENIDMGTEQSFDCDFVEVEKVMFQVLARHCEHIFYLINSLKWDLGEVEKAMFQVLPWHF